MGLEDRDYYRNTDRRTESPSGFSDLPPVCKWILVANVVVFLAQVLWTEPLGGPGFEKRLGEMSDRAEGVSEIDLEMLQCIELFVPERSVVQHGLELDPQKVRQGQLWRLFTSAFCHDRFSVWHLLINMLFLYWFGTRLESMYGAREFALFYFAATLCASVAFLALQYYVHDLSPAIGASGVVFGLAVLYTLHHPYETISIYFLFPVQMRWLLLIYVIFDLHPVLMQLSGQVFLGNTAHSAHLGGVLFGYLYFKRGWRLEPFYNRLPSLGKKDRNRSRLKTKKEQLRTEKTNTNRR